MENKINKTHSNKGRKNHNDKGLKTLAMMTKKLEPKSAMKTNEECQSGSNNVEKNGKIILIKSIFTILVYIIYLQRN